MQVKDLIETLSALDPNMEVWSTHPEDGLMWGPIASVGEAMTDKFQEVALIYTAVVVWDDEPAF